MRSAMNIPSRFFRKHRNIFVQVQILLNKSRKMHKPYQSKGVWNANNNEYTSVVFQNMRQSQPCVAHKSVTYKRKACKLSIIIKEYNVDG